MMLAQSSEGASYDNHFYSLYTLACQGEEAKISLVLPLCKGELERVLRLVCTPSGPNPYGIFQDAD
jgi:hypothetical protein